MFLLLNNYLIILKLLNIPIINFMNVMFYKEFIDTPQLNNLNI